jgi:hexosaminidase
VAYAASRYVVVVPEIDMPGHITAALTAYPSLRCNGVAPAPFTAIGGPPNTLCVDKDSTYQFVNDVVREIAAAAPTPYFHIGGDEVDSLTKAQYRGFIERVEGIVRAAGPRVVGWGEIAPANIQPSTIVQHWTAKDSSSSALHAARGGTLIMSPAQRGAYIDMKYDSTTVLGLMWAGPASLRKSYEWDPAAVLTGVADSSLLGVEAPLWAETVVTRQDYEYLLFPRLAALAEVAWSGQRARDWESFRRRIGAHGARLAALGVNFARVPGVDWGW